MAPRNNRANPNAPSRSATENLVQVLDTYVRPARDVMGEQAMAQGFSNLGNTLGNYSKRELRRETAEVERLAQADALAGNDPMEEFRQVRMGNIFRPHSRAYMDAYNATMGRVAAIDFRDRTALEYAESGLDQNTDPEAYRAWYNERLQAFLGENRGNPYFMSGALPQIEQTTFSMSAQHTSNIIRTMQANRAAAARRLSAEATMNTMGEWSRLEEQRVRFAESHPEWAADIALQQQALIANAVGGVASDFYATGDAGAPFRGATLEGALDFAEATGNRELLGSIMGAAGALRLRPDELLDVENRRQRIEADIITSMRNQEYLAERQRTEGIRQVRDLAADLALDPANMGMTPGQLMEASPALREAIMNSDDSAGLMEAFRTAWDSVTNVTEDIPDDIALENEADIRSAIANGMVSSPEEAVEWFRSEQASGRMFTAANRDLLMRLASEAGQPGAILSNAQFRDATTVATRMAVADLTGNAAAFDMTGNATDRAALFIQDAVVTYMQENSGDLNPNSPTYAQELRNLRDQAIIAAHDRFQATNPAAYDDRFNQVAEADDGADLLMSPGFINEVARRQIEAEAAIAEEDAAFAQIEEGFTLLGVNADGTLIETEAPTEVAPAEPEAPAETSSGPRRAGGRREVPEEDMITLGDVGRAVVDALSTEYVDPRLDRRNQPRDAEEPSPSITVEDVMATISDTVAVFEQVMESGGNIDPQEIEDLFQQAQRVSGGTVPAEMMRRINALRDR